MARPKSEENKSLTETELQIMNVLWGLESGTVHDVSEELQASQGKEYAYTTVSTLLRVLEKKDFVHSEKEGRGHRYYPALKRSQYQKKVTKHLVENVFEGEKTSLIRNLLGSGSLTEEELREIRQFLNGREIRD